MARFDVYRLVRARLPEPPVRRAGTRFVIPLVPPAEAPPRNARLNPSFDIEGQEHVLVTQFATALRTKELRLRATSLAGEEYRIIAAIDTLIGAG